MNHRRTLLTVFLTITAVIPAVGITAGIITSATSVRVCAGLMAVQLTAVLWLTVSALRDAAKRDHSSPQDAREELEQLRAALLRELSDRDQRLLERERRLNVRSLKLQEFLEYPLDVASNSGDDAATTPVRSGEQDRQVHELLEREAERFYRKIRNSEYSSNGRFDIRLLRDDALALMQQVARIYKPDCEQPLLETSFDQLARAASRICLQTLVLLEQLPVPVQHYSLAALAKYVRNATVGYDVYQKASPWLKSLSRSLYAGRIATAANPASLGAWWLATEIGRYGVTKATEHFIDRQAIAFLHDLVTVLGTEVAGIYGVGFRHRDPAWVLGTELVELVQAFPASSDSLRSALQDVTGLPLRSEYDRIYLYRCLAARKSAGLKLAEPALLTREERESIVRRLEAFFADHIHGARPESVQSWREGVERRFDIRMKLDRDAAERPGAQERDWLAAATSLRSFVSGPAAVPESQRAEMLAPLRCVTAVREPGRAAILTGSGNDAAAFEPPDLDPALDITSEYLRDLTTLCAAVEGDESLEMLIVEVFAYFRRPAREAMEELDRAWRSRAATLCVNESAAKRITARSARTFLQVREPGELLSCVYDDVGFIREETVIPLPEKVLLGLVTRDGRPRRLLMIHDLPSLPDGTGTGAAADRVVWQAEAGVRIVRHRGLLADSARVQQGQWQRALFTAERPDPTADVIVAGSLRGGRYSSYFRPLLEFAGGDESTAAVSV